MKTRREMRYAILVESIFAPDGQVVFRLRDVRKFDCSVNQSVEVFWLGRQRRFIDIHHLSRPTLTASQASAEMVEHARRALSTWESGTGIYRSIDEPKAPDIARWRRWIKDGPSAEETETYRRFHSIEWKSAKELDAWEKANLLKRRKTR